MARREVEAAEAARARVPGDPDDALVVVDGPLSGRQHVAGAVGVIKTHGVAYLPPDLHRLVGRLAPGRPHAGVHDRRPLVPPLLVPAPARRRRRAVGRGGAGRVLDRDLRSRARSASPTRSGVTLSRYASEPYKDPRAPQNLYPIGGLERELRRRLGDARLLFRALRAAAGARRRLTALDPGGAATSILS